MIISYIKSLFNKTPDVASENEKGFGTFYGVFLPCFLQMVGVILFMRLGWITSHVGQWKMLLIIASSASLIIITSLSMTSIVTNMKIGKGGSYYLISRSLGLELGSSLGLLLCLSQLTSIALTVTGFVYSLTAMFPHINTTYVELITITVIAAISYISTNLALKVQGVIFVALCLATISVFLGDASSIPPTMVAPEITSHLPYWAAFAMFFPAMTGTESGMAMSGELKNPSRSLPIGTISAAVVAFLLYATLTIFFSTTISKELLREYPMIAMTVARSPLLLTFGIWGATLSSALGSILSAPRTMQAVALDGMLPKFLAKGFGPMLQPRRATVVVFILACILTVLTDINQLIPILTMICLVTYTLVNFIALFESIIKNPSFRPAFETPWYISAIGFLGCIMCMLLINPFATVFVSALLILISSFASQRAIKGSWDDLRYSIYSLLAQISTVRLSALNRSPKSWRPFILSIVDPELKDENTVYFAHALNQSKGFLTFGSTVTPTDNCEHDTQRAIERFKAYFSERKIQCFYHINKDIDHTVGTKHIVDNYGLGPLRPNTLILTPRFEIENATEFSNLIYNSYSRKKNVLIFKASKGNPSIIFTKPFAKPKKINVWMKGNYSCNSNLSLALARVMQTGYIWKNCSITIKTIVSKGSTIASSNKELESYSKLIRMKSIRFQALSQKGDSIYEQIAANSNDAHLTFVGLRPPRSEESIDAYHDYYKQAIEETKLIQNVCYVLAGENLDFGKIFT